MSKIIEVIQKLILSISKERKALYNNLNNKLEDYSEEELLYLLDYENIKIEKEAQAWDQGIEFVYDQNIKYRDSIHRLFKYYSVGCYTLHYRNIVWCCISI